MLPNVQDQRPPTVNVALHAEQEFAARLRELRTEHGLSQQDIADRLAAVGVKLDATAITRIEKNAHGPTGARSIRLGEAVAIALVFGQRVTSFLTPAASLDDRIEAARAEAEELHFMTERMGELTAAARQHLSILERIQRREAENTNSGD